ncbi:prolipoprotein diacylglyceryl transferase [Nocardioides daphniae]|uniref:prolipoprotein diacylglyceryl transferase n=1 Tax=Nocardioides daphniae TaxID=402297 RepID=UPI00360F064E
MQDLALWAVPFGLVGGRLYHVVTDHQLYFGDGNDPITALYVWRGGLGIWGAIALGALGVVIGARLKGIKVLPFLDALAPGVLLAQGIGRWGNWFNQELYGRPTDLPWGLEIDDAHRPYDYVGADVVFHPTFLYESLWALAGCLLLLWLDRRRRFAPGQLVALYVMVYTAGRVWIENLRIDSVQYDDLLGLRLNSWTSILLFAVALVCFWLLRRRAAQEAPPRPPSVTGVRSRPVLRRPLTQSRATTDPEWAGFRPRWGSQPPWVVKFRRPGQRRPARSSHRGHPPPLEAGAATQDDGRNAHARIPASPRAVRPRLRARLVWRGLRRDPDRRCEPRHRGQGPGGPDQHGAPRRRGRRDQLR